MQLPVARRAFPAILCALVVGFGSNLALDCRCRFR